MSQQKKKPRNKRAKAAKKNVFLETRPVGQLMRQYAVPCIISLLVRRSTTSSIRFSLPTQAISVPTATPPTPWSFRSLWWRSPSPS